MPELSFVADCEAGVLASDGSPVVPLVPDSSGCVAGGFDGVFPVVDPGGVIRPVLRRMNVQANSED